MVPKIHIGFVVYSRFVDMEILAMLSLLSSQQKYAFTIQFGSGCYISQNRNTITYNFRDTKESEWLFFWDADVAVRDASFLDKMLETAMKFDAKIVAGCYRMKNKPGLYPICMDDPTKPGNFVNLTDEDVARGPQYVDYATTGLMLIHRDVIEKLSPPWFQVEDLEDGLVFPEDFYICKRAREAGFKVAIDPRFDTYHQMYIGVPHKAVP